ncbi:hypothetical protein J6590_097463 [Homalodisca vitripennis]|nr:hypothetical protein J6590_097463 [Homalodisca vitripennis]
MLYRKDEDWLYITGDYNLYKTTSLSSADLDKQLISADTQQPIPCRHWTSSSSSADNRQPAHPLRTLDKQPIPCGHWTSSSSPADNIQAAYPLRTLDKQLIPCGHWTSSSSPADTGQAAHPLQTLDKQLIPCIHWTSSSSPAGTGQAAHTLRTLDNQLHQKVFTDQLQVHLKSFETTSADDIEFQLHRFKMPYGCIISQCSFCLARTLG